MLIQIIVIRNLNLCVHVCESGGEGDASTV
jgi:hypothetical protein